MTVSKNVSLNDIDDGKPCAVLSYLFPVGLVWYFTDSMMRKNEFVAYHIYQGLAGALVVAAAIILGHVLDFIFIGDVIGWLAWLAGLVWLIQGMIHALRGEKRPLWLVGSFGERFDF